MGMTPSQYFESFVEGNLGDCHADPGCVRRAFNAAVSASHLADHFHTFNSRNNPQTVAAFPSIGQYVEYLTNKTGGAFRDIRSISNAYKHLYTDVGPMAVHSNIDSSGAIESIELPNSQELTRVAEDYAANRSFVVFTRKDGSTLEFLPVLEQVVDYWRQAIYDGA
jgi:hypothetical protein